MKLKELFTSIYSIIIFLLIVLFIVSILRYINTQKMVQSETIAKVSFQIADELRQSSDDLTNYCRMYVETGDSTWENKYWEVLDIRNGKKPRPDGRTIALLDSMRILGFINAEFAKLNESEEKSNELVWTETVAFHAVKGLFADSTSHFSIKKTPDVAMARSIMFDKKYQYDKSVIMKPIDDFIIMVKQRTQNEVDKHAKIRDWSLYIVLGLIFIILLISVISYFLIRYRIIKQLEELKAAKARIEESEDHLKRQNEILDKKIEERTNDLKEKNEELTRSGKELYIASEKLRKSEEKFSKAFNSSPVGISIARSSDGLFLECNDSLCKLWGYSRDEIIGKTALKLNIWINPDDRKYFIEKLNRNSLVQSYEASWKNKNGSVVTTLFSSTLIDYSGEPCILSVLEDITERKVAEEQLEMLKKSIDIAPDGAYWINEDGQFLYVNDEGCKALGYTREEIMQIHVSDWNPKANPEAWTRVWNQLKETKHFTNISKHRRKDGSEFPVEYTYTYNNLRGKEYIAGFAKDITERIRAEKAIESINITLEQKVIERTAQLEAANKAKSEFLANMSHEIRTPLNAVLGYADLLAFALEDKTQIGYLESIKSSGRGLLTLINDILDLSKIEAGRLELEFDYVYANFFFSEFEKIFSAKMSEKGLKFILDIVPETPAGLYVDETRLRQIIFNLVGNAIKFTDTGFVGIKVYVQNPQTVLLANNQKDEYIDLIIEVSDSGIGISKEFQKEMFDPFTQQEGQKKFGGTGLGLAITRRLINLMNGTISVNSELNKGSTFQIIIPDVAFLKDFEREEVKIQINTREIVFEHRNMIIADDIESNRKYLIDALKNTNIKISEAENGEKAYLLARELIPDLIITDIRMPRMNGFELLDKLKQDDKLKHIPVIAYSASVMKDQKEKIHNSEFAGLLMKPVRVTELFMALMNYLPYTTDKISEVELSDQTVDTVKNISDITGLISTLETSYCQKWKTFSNRQPIDEIEEFGKDLIGLGKEHNAIFISEYGEELVSAANSFNIKAILKLIKKYPAIIDELKVTIQKTEK